MRMAVLSVFCALSALAVTGPAQPADSAQQRRGDQQEAFEARRNGRILPLRDIERRIVPAMKDSHYLGFRSEEHTSELQSLMRISYAVFCLKKTITRTNPLDHYITPTNTPK